MDAFLESRIRRAAALAACPRAVLPVSGRSGVVLRRGGLVETADVRAWDWRRGGLNAVCRVCARDQCRRTESWLDGVPGGGGLAVSRVELADGLGDFRAPHASQGAVVRR